MQGCSTYECNRVLPLWAQALSGQNNHIIYVPVNGVKMLLIKFNHENCIVFYKGFTALTQSQNWGLSRKKLHVIAENEGGRAST